MVLETQAPFFSLMPTMISLHQPSKLKKSWRQPNAFQPSASTPTLKISLTPSSLVKNPLLTPLSPSGFTTKRVLRAANINILASLISTSSNYIHNQWCDFIIWYSFENIWLNNCNCILVFDKCVKILLTVKTVTNCWHNIFYFYRLVILTIWQIKSIYYSNNIKITIISST